VTDRRASRPAIVPDLPTVLYVEVTNRCDSLCQTCIRTFRTLEPPKDLTLGELARIVEQFPRLERVLLHGIGEPLLNPDLIPMIAALKRSGVTVLFNSDAIGLTPKRRQDLIAVGLDELRVSMDAATAETYRAIRGVSAFEKVVQNVTELIQLRRTKNAATPVVSLWFTTTRRNAQELPDFVRLAARIGADRVNLQRLVYYGEGLAVAEQSLHGGLQSREDEYLAQASRLAAELGISLQASGNSTPEASFTPDERPRPWAGCQRPWTLSYVTANGNVLPCCISPWTTRNYQRLILGNVHQQPFVEIWNGPRYQEFRTRFETEEAPDPCHGCGRCWAI